jgi:uncharacterized protein YndB with AHSA1/START domain
MERVWNAWTDPALIKRWWGPDHFECPTARIDFREGGTSLVSMASPEYGFPEQYSTWRYTKIVPHERIEYIHNLADPEGNPLDPASAGMPPDFPQEMQHIVAFKDLGGARTRLTVTEKDWPDGQMMELSRQGMEQCLDKLAKALE